MCPRNKARQPADPVAQYLNEISGIEPLTKEEEGRLANHGRQVDLDTLVVRNLRFVVQVANRYKGLGMSLADLVNEGNVGLVEASRRFDPDRKVKFITYAVWWIRQSILRALSEQSRVVRLPVKQAGKLKSIIATINRLTHENKAEPAVEDVALELGMRTKSLEAILRVYRNYMSLDSPISDEEDSVRFLDLLHADHDANVEEEYITLCMRRDIHQLLNALSEKEREVLKLRFGFDEPPMTLENIGGRVGLTRERVRQIEKRAKEKLKSEHNLKILEDYLR